MFDMKNKVVILTGSSGRLGTEYSHILSQAGANLVLVDKNSNKNQKLKESLKKKYSSKPLTLSIDISKSKDVEDMTNAVVKKYGKIDVLINNAFYNPNQSKSSSLPFEKFPLDLWNSALNVNLTGTFLCSQSVGKVMAKYHNGVIAPLVAAYETGEFNLLFP